MGLEPIIKGQIVGFVALWWWSSPHPLGPWLRLCRLSEANWFEAIISLLQGRRRWWQDHHSLSITIIASGFYELVMGPESGQPSVLLSQFGDLLMG